MKTMMLLLLLFFQGGTRPLPQRPLDPLVLTGGTHGAIIWRTFDGVRHKERITQEQYNALASPIPKPLTFVGTDQEWFDLLVAGRVTAFGGRPTVSSPTGEQVLWTLQLINATRGTRIVMWTGADMDLEEAPRLVFTPEEITGTFPEISTVAPVCGVTILNRVILASLLDVNCAQNSLRKLK